MLKIGSHVGMSGKEMLLGSAKEATSYGANTFMIYTGAPQNTKRKPVSELNIEAGWNFMKDNGIDDFIIHAPYLINLANTLKPETIALATEFLASEMERTAALRSKVLVLHPGSHVGAGSEIGIKQVIKGLNTVLTRDTSVLIALETMSGKGNEVGRSFEELAEIYDGVVYSDKLRVCFDTCHVNDSGYDIVGDFDGVMEDFDRLIGNDQIAAFHLNDSKNKRGASKDRHENIGFGTLGFETLYHILMHPDFTEVPKILETPYVEDLKTGKKTFPPYKYEIEMLKQGCFDPNLIEKIRKDHEPLKDKA